MIEIIIIAVNVCKRCSIELDEYCSHHRVYTLWNVFPSVPLSFHSQIMSVKEVHYHIPLTRREAEIKDSEFCPSCQKMLSLDLSRHGSIMGMVAHGSNHTTWESKAVQL